MIWLFGSPVIYVYGNLNKASKGREGVALQVHVETIKKTMFHLKMQFKKVLICVFNFRYQS